MEKKELKGKQFLEGLLQFETEIREKREELAYWKGQEDSFPDLQVQLEAREHEVQLLLGALTQKKLDATRMIDNMRDPVGRAVLRHRYIFGKTWTQVADGCGGMSERNAHYIHDAALIDFEKIYLSA